MNTEQITQVASVELKCSIYTLYVAVCSFKVGSPAANNTEKKYNAII